MTDYQNSTSFVGDVQQNAASGASLNHIFNVLWLRKRILLSVTFTISLLAVLSIYQLVPRYTASTQLLIGINSHKVVDIQEVLGGGVAGDTAVIGEMEVIKSRELARKLISELNLEQYEEFNPDLKKTSFFAQLNPKNLIPESWKIATGVEAIEASDADKKEVHLTHLTNAFLSKLTVLQVKKSQVVSISFESIDPKLAAHLANKLADKYILGQLQAKFDATKKATDWLNDQLSDLKKKVEHSEFAVENYRKSHNLIEISKGTGVSQQQLSEISSQLITSRAQRAEAEAKYQQIEAIARSGKDIDSVADVLNSGLITSLRGQESEVQRKYSEMLVEYGPRHPRMIQMQAEINDIKAKIAQEIKKIAASVRNTLEVSRAHESSLSGSLKQIENKNTGNSQAEIALHALERESTANKALFETFLGRFKETASTQGISQADARVISFAEIPLGPSFPKTNILIPVSLLSALLLGIAAIFVLEKLSPGVRSPEQIQELFNMPTLAIIPVISDLKMKPHEYIIDKPQSGLAEAINTLSISLSLLNPDSLVKSILITSSVPSEGKSTLATLLAKQAASTGKRVLLIDCDLRRPTIGKSFGIDKSLPGLTDLLMNHDLEINEVLIDAPQSSLKILLNGQAAYVNPSNLFSSHRMTAIMDQFKTQFDLVVLDSPPIMAVPDTRILGRLVDATIFVLHWDKTPKKVIANALQILNSDGHNNLAGIVLQKVNLAQYGRHGYGDSGYYYSYSRYKEYYTN